MSNMDGKTKEEERIAMLKEYKDELEKEGRGVIERIKELEAS